MPPHWLRRCEASSMGLETVLGHSISGGPVNIVCSVYSCKRVYHEQVCRCSDQGQSGKSRYRMPRIGSVLIVSHSGLTEFLSSELACTVHSDRTSTQM